MLYNGSIYNESVNYFTMHLCTNIKTVTCQQILQLKISQAKQYYRNLKLP